MSSAGVWSANACRACRLPRLGLLPMVIRRSFHFASDGKDLVADCLVAADEDLVAVDDSVVGCDTLGGPVLKHGYAHLVERVVNLPAEAGSRLGHGNDEGRLGRPVLVFWRAWATATMSAAVHTSSVFSLAGMRTGSATLTVSVQALVMPGDPSMRVQS